MNLETYVRASLKDLRFHPSRLRGQHFLVDESVQESLVRRANLNGGDTVIEVGTGLATLTRRLARSAGRIFTFEIESALFGFLERELAVFPNVTLIKKSFNSYSLGELIETFDNEWDGGTNAIGDGDESSLNIKRRVKVCANLPYQITNLFLRAVVEYQEWIELVCVMLQREVAERLAAAPGSRAYGSLSVWLQTYFDVEHLAEVQPDSFIPPPKVHSTIIAMTPCNPITRVDAGIADKPDITKDGGGDSDSDLGVELPAPDSEMFFRLVEGLFRHRRKTVENALRKAFPGLTTETATIALTRARVARDARPEKLGRDELHALAVEIGKLGLSTKLIRLDASGADDRNGAGFDIVEP